MGQCIMYCTLSVNKNCSPGGNFSYLFLRVHCDLNHDVLTATLGKMCF